MMVSGIQKSSLCLNPLQENMSLVAMEHKLTPEVVTESDFTSQGDTQD
jgi:hypothetical protein